MTFTNHILSGSLLAKLLPLPIALPLAFASHFVLDSLPHFGFKAGKITNLKLFYGVEVLDFSFGAVIIGWLLLRHEYAWVVSGLVAFSPDLVWFYRYIFKEKFGKLHIDYQAGWLTTIHKRVQRYERYWGLVIELVYGLSVFTLLR